MGRICTNWSEAMYMCDTCGLVDHNERRFIYTESGTYCNNCCKEE